MNQIQPTLWNFLHIAITGIQVVCFLSILGAQNSVHSMPPAEDGKFSGSVDDSVSTVGLSPIEVRTGWISLFDGKSTFGWRKASKANWQVSDDVISVSEGERGLLRTTSQFDDFELKVDFKIGKSTNSGIFIRSSPKPKDPAVDCIEVNLASLGVSPFPTGTLVARKKGADISGGNDSWFEDWHEAHIIADGPIIQIRIDGEETCSYTDPKGKNGIGRGYIGLQLNSGLVQFRSVKLRPLNVPKIFNGNDLTQWNTDQKLDSEFNITDNGEMQILSGRGQIETEGQYGDFIFSLNCKTNAEGLNSGVFFRCIPGQLMNGYESQIQNQFKDQDRTNPVDCGTGGIFRRQPARRVNANDNEWFSKTIIMTGPHVSVWVNGYQVTDWTDKRKPDANPRRGLRIEKGTIIFQGHDPTTDILVKDIRAREQKPRNR